MKWDVNMWTAVDKQQKGKPRSILAIVSFPTSLSLCLLSLFTVVERILFALPAPYSPLPLHPTLRSLRRLLVFELVMKFLSRNSFCNFLLKQCSLNNLRPAPAQMKNQNEMKWMLRSECSIGMEWKVENCSSAPLSAPRSHGNNYMYVLRVQALGIIALVRAGCGSSFTVSHLQLPTTPSGG